jgi:hypothetical protein
VTQTQATALLRALARVRAAKNAAEGKERHVALTLRAVLDGCHWRRAGDSHVHARASVEQPQFVVEADSAGFVSLASRAGGVVGEAKSFIDQKAPASRGAFSLNQ